MFISAPILYLVLQIKGAPNLKVKIWTGTEGCKNEITSWKNIYMYFKMFGKWLFFSFFQTGPKFEKLKTPLRLKALILKWDAPNRYQGPIQIPQICPAGKCEPKSNGVVKNEFSLKRLHAR